MQGVFYSAFLHYNRSIVSIDLIRGCLMENGFSILMLIFAGVLFLYGLLMILIRDYRMVPFRARVSVRPKNPKKYTARLGIVILLVALAVALGAAVAFWKMWVGGIVMIVGVVGAIWIGAVKIVKEE